MTAMRNVIWLVVPRKASATNKNGEEKNRKGIVRRKVNPSGDPIHESKIVVNGLENRIVESRIVSNTPCCLFEKKTNDEYAKRMIKEHNPVKLIGELRFVMYPNIGSRIVS
jgi:hypothetical protein